MTPADTYTHGHHQSVLRSHNSRTVENSAGYLLPDLTSGQRVLDIGCGPGSITLGLATLVAPGQTVGLDREVAPLVVARAAATEQGVRNVGFTVGDVYQLDFPDDSFDIVHAHQVLQHLTDPIAALREMSRVCRPGGIVAARDADYAAMSWYPADPRLDRWLELYHQVALANGAEPDAGRRLVAWAHAAGLTDVTGSATAWCYTSVEERAWWGGNWSERITESAIATQAIDGGYSDRPELDDIAAGWRAWAAHDDGWFAILHGEIRCRVG
jgi:ubiquinone/menaquinone biosynthesis C-methylase UbiE